MKPFPFVIKTNNLDDFNKAQNYMSSHGVYWASGDAFLDFNERGVPDFIEVSLRPSMMFTKGEDPWNSRWPIYTVNQIMGTRSYKDE